MALLTIKNYIRNVAAAKLLGDRVALPIFATYHVTSYCNLACTYCEDYGLHKNKNRPDPWLQLADAKHVLRVIRTATENIVFTGGEPLLHKNIEELLAYAREIGFRTVNMITNAVLLPKKEGVLPHLTRLVISLDSLDTKAWDKVLGINKPGTAARIIANIEHYAKLQDKYGYNIAINCVVTPATVSMVRDVIDFCERNKLSFSLSPQGVNDHPHEGLVKMPEYRALVADVLAMKQTGRNVLGSAAYLSHMLDFEEFQCYPTVNMRVMENGDFIYPCRPIAEMADGRGGVACNLRSYDDFADALRHAVEQYGQPPEGCQSCFQQCFAEPSLFIDKPLRMLPELKSYMRSRKNVD